MCVRREYSKQACIMTTRTGDGGGVVLSIDRTLHVERVRVVSFVACYRLFLRKSRINDVIYSLTFNVLGNNVFSRL